METPLPLPTAPHPFIESLIITYWVLLGDRDCVVAMETLVTVELMVWLWVACRIEPKGTVVAKPFTTQPLAPRGFSSFPAPNL